MPALPESGCGPTWGALGSVFRVDLKAAVPGWPRTAAWGQRLGEQVLLTDDPTAPGRAPVPASPLPSHPGVGGLNSPSLVVPVLLSCESGPSRGTGHGAPTRLDTRHGGLPCRRRGEQARLAGGQPHPHPPLPGREAPALSQAAPPCPRPRGCPLPPGWARPGRPSMNSLGGWGVCPAALTTQTAMGGCHGVSLPGPDAEQLSQTPRGNRVGPCADSPRSSLAGWGPRKAGGLSQAPQACPG